MIKYINRIRWNAIKSKYKREQENFRLDDVKGQVIITKHYYLIDSKIQQEEIN